MTQPFVDASSGRMYRHDPTTRTAEPVDGGEQVQTWRIEIRFDFTGTKAEATETAGRAANGVPGDNGEVTAIFDEKWNEVDE